VAAPGPDLLGRAAGQRLRQALGIDVGAVDEVDTGFTGAFHQQGGGLPTDAADLLEKVRVAGHPVAHGNSPD
jgi:hypothetical protein